MLDGISVESMEFLNEDVYKKKKKEENDTFCTSRVGTIKSLLATDCSASSMSLMDSVVIL